MHISRSYAHAFCCLFVVVFSSCLVTTAHAQAVLVSEYYNASDPAFEWNEIIVVQDNLDMRGYFEIGRAHV